MELLGLLWKKHLMAVIRGSDPEASFQTACVLAEEGIDVIEVSLTGAGALKVISRIGAELGDRVVLGASTVMTRDEAGQARDAGVAFIVTPAMCEGAARGVELGVPTVIGALTPSEVWSASASGAMAVKVFPASVFGPSYVASLRGPFPRVPLIPMGGIEADQMAAYLDAGAVAVGIGSPLIGDAADGGDLAGLRERARRFRRALPYGEALP
ncbi:bifunctional 4-hydroxy-2-oxoglutarate aldolase/2-dehydro-3-deoxy-phosphogluconate aldolase [Sphaerisporangium corydalis]|uniref:Bifunctional 4-hydroxy-2-oxoglutarate aldolase/2-dehydro-3-deoxy-phosphogluconate aldolase n=1 Tax=Sphaerisporangium corydalis TaxID=1441875 RepID=A0ABV9ECS5_9ACTN|nr:bifunctional 4-hydroxy-2-oxoglutarate aldolase/2-dehydro-3-deoxy-phosphogluconate aldolase [Sphaerisporangium corydalis]